MFSLVGRLHSMPSANGFPLLFGHFVGTVRPSDSPSTCMLDFWFMTFSNRPAHEIVTGVAGVSRFSRMEFPCMLGVSTARNPLEACVGASIGMAFRLGGRRRHSGSTYFAARYPACMCPCQRFTTSLATGRA